MTLLIVVLVVAALAGGFAGLATRRHWKDSDPMTRENRERWH